MRKLRSLALSKLQIAALLCIGAPPVLIYLCDFVVQNLDSSGHKHFRDIQCAEFFGGCESVVRGFRELGAQAQSVDISKDEVTQNLAETIGLLRFVRLALRCQEGGLGLLGTPCNSFGWMASSQHERTFASPWGNMTFPFVIIGNLLATRSCLVVSILVVRSVFWMLENPDRSKVAVFPPLMHLMSISDMWPLRVYWAMGYYGGWSVKPEMGFGNAPWMPYLNRKVTQAIRIQIQQRADRERKEMVKTTVSKSSQKKTVSGGRDLRSSAMYPRDFGREVASQHLSYMASNGQLPDLKNLVRGGFKEPPPGLWDHGDMQPLLAFVENAIQQGLLRYDPLIPVSATPSREVFERVRARWVKTQVFVV